MRILAIDCATESIGMAFMNEGEVCAEVYLRRERHHTEILLSSLERLLSLADAALNDVDLLACTIGPGSFTGLRIGVSTVKGLALAMGKPVVGVSTLEALAMNALPYGKIICPMLDARRNEVFTALFRSGPEGLPEAMMPEVLIDIDQFLTELKKGEIVFLGSGAMRHEERIVGILPNRALVGGKGGKRILASAVGLIGLHRYRQGHILDTQTFVPNYLRLSDAESHRAIRSLRYLVTPEG